MKNKKNNDVSYYGVRERYDKTGKYARQLEEIYYNGFTILEGVLKEKEVREYSKLIDELYKFQIAELGGVKIAEQISDSNNIRCPLAYSDKFIELAKNKCVIDITKEILGENFVLMMQNAVINMPVNGNFQSKWHRDLNYQHWVCNTPLTINALFTIDPFTIQTGCTHVLPGTHLRNEFPSDNFVKKYEIPAVAKPGSVIIMDSMLYHRAGKNNSDRPRRAVNHVIGMPFMAQQIDIPEFVGDRLNSDAFSRMYFGYQWHPSKSAKDWRLSKLSKKTN